MKKLIRIVVPVLAALSVVTLVYAGRPAPAVCNQGNAYNLQQQTMRYCSGIKCFKGSPLWREVAYQCETWCCPEDWGAGAHMICDSGTISWNCCNLPPGTPIGYPPDMTCPEPSGGSGGG